jgi:hypothetical protein
MSPLLTDRVFWLRVALIASTVWVGGTIVFSMVWPHDFRWFPNVYRNDYSFGPAMITAMTGVIVAFVVCFCIPWAADRAKELRRD